MISVKYSQKSLSEDDNSKMRKKARTENKFFNKVYVTVTAASKMLNHAKFGEPEEVMGLLQGYYLPDSTFIHGYFVITDIISLPVEASETRVTADDQTFLIMAAYSEWITKIHTHSIIGWYHSHPSYGCWLSGIDVNTQQRFQMTEDPFIAIVVDPIKSVNLQTCDMAAFRVYNNGYKDETLASVKDVPRRKAVDFGYHYQRYYQIPIEFVTNQQGLEIFKKVQKKDWVQTISQSSFFNQFKYLTEQVKDQKLDIDQYLEVKENPSSKLEQIKEKERTTLKKVAYYTKERNISLLDSAIKSLLF